MKDQISIQNRKASHDFTFLKKLVAGIELQGTEVKSVREGRVSLVDSFCYFSNGELFVKSMIITAAKNAEVADPGRDKKLLLKRTELDKLQKELIDGCSVIVTKLFSNERGFIKAEIALAKGKKNYDKRQALKEKDIKREINRALDR